MGIRFWSRERRRARERELQEELDAHFALDIDQRMQAGAEREEAEYSSRRDFGNVTRVMEVTREMAGGTILAESIIQDLRFAARTLRHSLGFTTVAILALALGIAVNTSVFTAYKAMVARPIDARDADQIVNIALLRSTGSPDVRFSYPDYQSYRTSVHAFSGLVAFRREDVTLSDAGGIVSQRRAAAGSFIGKLGLLSTGAINAEFASALAVSQSYFDVLGVKASRGRTFSSMSVSDLVASPSILISDNYWQRRFSRDPSTLGKMVRLNGFTFQVIGITPHDFIGSEVSVPDFWIPLALEPLLHADDKWLYDRENQCCRMLGRLASGVRMPRAQAEVNAVADRLRQLHDPHSDLAKAASALVWPGSPFPLPLKFYSGLKLTILLIMLAAAMLLFVACANVGSLQLARARSRHNELHTRLSLGASRGRIIRQLLTESGLLGLGAGVVALTLAWIFLRLLVMATAAALPPEYGTLVFQVTPDLSVFVYVMAVSLIAGILFGLAPALETSSSAISLAARGSTSSGGARRLQNLLVAAQVSLSLVLMIAGSMLIRSSINSLTTRPGYDAEHVISVSFQFPEAARYSADRKLAVIRELRSRLAALPGATEVTSADAPNDSAFSTPASTADESSGTSKTAPSIYYRYVQSNYFETLGIPLPLGRPFLSRAYIGNSVILSESAANELWPGENPIGHHIRLGAIDERAHKSNDIIADGPSYDVVGVAHDTRGVEFDGSDSRQIYLPLRYDQLTTHAVLVRTTSSAQSMRLIDGVISSVDPELLVTPAVLQDQLRLSAPFLTATLAAAISSSIGSLGLLLAVMGIYGTVSYIVVLRTREVGIRMAIGAQKRDVLSLILRESARPVVIGLIVGALLAIGAAHALRPVLFGISTIDGISLVGVSVIFFFVALFAAYPPSRRATRVDPAVALRYD